MKTRFFSSLLALCMVLTLIPVFSVPAEAASENYTLFLNSTDGKFYKNSSSGDAVTPAGASVSGVAGGWILTLTNFSFETTAAVALILPAGSSIELVGDNTVTSKYSGEAISSGIYNAGSLSIYGIGTLRATGGTSTASESNGIRADSSITISGSATIIATGGTAESNSLGICVFSDTSLIIKDSSTVTANGGKAEISSFGLYSGNLTISDNATVTAASGAAETNSYGIRAAKFTASDSADITVTSGTATANNSIGLRANSGFKVSGSAALNVTSGTAGNFSYAVYASNPTINDNATVTVTGGSSANGSIGFYKFDGAFYINDNATLTAASGTAPKNCYGIHMSNGVFVVSGGTITATGNTRAIYPDYPAPYGSTYYVNTAISPSTTPLKGGGFPTVIGSTHKYAKLEVDPELVISSPFSDVNTSDWFFGAVKYAYDNNLMNGTSDTLFSPDSNLNRAMLVTLLYRYEGEPAVTASNPFSDVQAGQWYTNAIIWASENEIVNGYGSGTFGPNDNVTREQVAAVLYRYADWNELDVSKTTALTAFTDRTEISAWALDAMKWANAEGLMSGRTPTTLVPKGTMVRAEVATILMRFIEDFVK